MKDHGASNTQLALNTCTFGHVRSAAFQILAALVFFKVYANWRKVKHHPPITHRVERIHCVYTINGQESVLSFPFGRTMIPPQSYLRRSRIAFSLVEVAIALGIFAFAIVSVIGLLSAVLQSEKAAAEDALLGRMAGNTISLLKSQGIAAIRANPAFSNNDSTDYFFDVTGRMAVATNGQPLTAVQSDSIFGCVIRRKSTMAGNRDVVEIEFRWPVTAPANSQKTRHFQTSLVQYD